MNGFSFRGSASYRNFINFCLENYAAVGEEKNVVVSIGASEVGEEVAFFNVGTNNAAAAALLNLESRGRQTLYIAVFRHRDYCFFFRYQIFGLEFLEAAGNNLSAALVAELIFNLI